MPSCVSRRGGLFGEFNKQRYHLSIGIVSHTLGTSRPLPLAAGSGPNALHFLSIWFVTTTVTECYPSDDPQSSVHAFVKCSARSNYKPWRQRRRWLMKLKVFKLLGISKLHWVEVSRDDTENQRCRETSVHRLLFIVLRWIMVCWTHDMVSFVPNYSWSWNVSQTQMKSLVLYILHHQPVRTSCNKLHAANHARYAWCNVCLLQYIQASLIYVREKRTRKAQIKKTTIIWNISSKADTCTCHTIDWLCHT